MNNDLISVIIPTYNRETTLLDSVNSVLNQSYDNLELIIIDDCSNDNTEKIVNQIKDHRINYIKLDKNKGSSEARNIGIKNASGNYIAFQDSDDIWFSEKLQKQINKFITDDTLGIVYSGYDLLYNENYKQYVPPRNLNIELKEGNIYKSILKANKIGTPTMLVKRDVFNNIGGFDTNLKAYEDWEINIRITKRYKIGFIDEALVKAIYNQDGVNSNSKNIIMSLCYILYKHKDDIIKYGLFTEKVNQIIEYCYNTNELITYAKSKLIPEIIANDIDFDLLLYQVNKINKFRNYYEDLVLIEKIDIIGTSLKELFELNNWKSIAIYGMGNIGKILYKKLIKAGINVKYGIDMNDIFKDDNYRIIKPFDIDKDLDLLIISISVDYTNIAQSLRNYTSCRIMSIKELLN